MPKRSDADLSLSRLQVSFWELVSNRRAFCLFVCIFVLTLCPLVFFDLLATILFVEQAVFLISSSGLQCYSAMGLFFTMNHGEIAIIMIVNNDEKGDVR